MKFIAVACLAFLACACAIPSSLPALQHDEIRDEFGQYAMRYATDDGTIAYERGRLIRTPDGTDHVLVYDGETRHIAPDGKTYVTKYTAGLDGFKAEGEHLHKAPETESA